MNRKMKIKLLVDIIMTVIFLFQMSNRFTGNAVHEVLGIILFLLFIVHNILNKKWYQSAFKGKYNLYRTMNLITNMLLLTTMMLQLISAIPISRTVFTFLNLDGTIDIRRVHTSAIYWGLIFMGMHIGMHWKMVMGAVNKMTVKKQRSHAITIFMRIIAILIVINGIRASFIRNMWYKMISYYTFEVYVANETLFTSIMDYFCIMAIYVFIMHYLLAFIQFRGNAKKAGW